MIMVEEQSKYSRQCDTAIDRINELVVNNVAMVALVLVPVPFTRFKFSRHSISTGCAIELRVNSRGVNKPSGSTR